MKAIVQSKYGPPVDVLKLQEIDEPMVAADEVLVKVHAASLDAGVWHFVEGLPYILRLTDGLLTPKHTIPGREVAGRVEAVGSNVTHLQPGDEVFGELEEGACAEYVSAPEDGLVPKPAGLSFEQAAAVGVSACTALQALRDHGKVQAGQKVLVNGASGGVGTFAVQIAKAMGAEVTGVCSTRNAELVRSIGADQVVDYTGEDFTQGEQRYDLMLDIAGSRSLSECLRVIQPNGTCVAIGGGNGRWLGPLGHMVSAVLKAPLVSQNVRTFVAAPSRADLLFVKELIEAGNLTPVIDRTYPLSEAPDAIRYLAEGHARGKIVIAVRDAESVESPESRYLGARPG